MSRPLEGAEPKLKTPSGVVDTHIHFYMSQYPGQPGGPPAPEDATVTDYGIVQKRLGIERAVIVQSNAHQMDNRCTLHALEQMGDRKARAIVCIKPDISDGELERLHGLGVRGVRIMQLGGPLGLDWLLPVNARIAPVGWHPIVQFDGRNILQYKERLEKVRGDYVIDHTAKFLEPVSPDSAEFKALLELVDRGNCYVKISAAYETSKTGRPDYSDVGALATRLIAHAPERMLWASNWPHVSTTLETYPDDAELLDVLLAWAPDEAVRTRILVDNPVRLYGFE
ncbi:MAG: amidohydrolase family protein [Hyphomicrobiales bacterium]|nr:amidohydrolase family protein [Hyphomicrobiales bacterium]